MAIALVQNSAYSSAVSGNLALTPGAGASVAGNLLVAVLHGRATTPAAFSAPANWVRAIQQINGQFVTEIWYYPNCPASIAAQTFTSANTEVAGSMSEWSGADTASQPDVTGVGSTANGVSKIVATSAATTQAGDLGIVAATSNDAINGPFVEGHGLAWTKQSEISGWDTGLTADSSWAYQLGIASGATPSDTITQGGSTSTTWATAVATFKAVVVITPVDSGRRHPADPIALHAGRRLPIQVRKRQRAFLSKQRNPVADAPAAAQVNISDADSSAATDAASQIALATATDAATGNDTASSILLATATDQATGNDGPLTDALISGADAATATDAASSIGLATAADAGSGADAATLIAISSADSGTGSDGDIVGLAAADSGTATDAASLLATSGTDSAAGADAAILIALVGSDSAQGSDSALGNVNDSDVATAADAASLIAVSGVDAGTASDGAPGPELVAAADAGTATENAVIAFQAADAATIGEGAVVAAVSQIVAADSATASEGTDIVVIQGAPPGAGPLGYPAHMYHPPIIHPPSRVAVPIREPVTLRPPRRRRRRRILALTGVDLVSATALMAAIDEEEHTK